MEHSNNVYNVRIEIDEKEIQTMQAVLKLVKYIKPYIWFAILAPTFMIIEVAMDLLQPTILEKIIDNGIAKEDSVYIGQMFGLMLAVAFIGLIGGVACSVYASRAAVNFATDIRQDLYTTITYFSNKNKDKFTIGKLITNMTTDLEMIQRALVMLLKIFVRGPLLFIGAVLIVFFTAREFFVILMVVVPILAFLMYFFTMISGKLFAKVQLVIDQVNTRVQETLSGIRVIKAYNRGQHQIEQFTDVNVQLMKRNVFADQVVGVLMPLTQFIVNIGIVAALWLGAIKVEVGVVQVGTILAFINYLMIVMQGLTSSSMVLINLARAVPSAERIVAVLEEEPAVQNEVDAKTLAVRGDVVFENVTFAYNEVGEPVLKDVSFTAKAGETIGIIGMTGSGKSTLMKMLPRLFDVQAGRVLVDGVDVRQHDISNLRQSIGFAPQKATLFSKTVKENIHYGDETANDLDIWQALQSASASEFVKKLEGELDYHVTQGATNLSGGQKQRLAMARAFVRKPAILVLDDVTSAVDSISERKIQAAIREHFNDSTKFIVSSKISSIKEANQILVLDDGAIVGRGTHEELLTTCPLYKEIATTQIEKGGTL